MDGFSEDVWAHINYYVYRLIDPRDGTTFYVGRGQNNRVFEHAAAAQPATGKEDSDSLKLKTIREIHLAGLQAHESPHFQMAP